MSSIATSMSALCGKGFLVDYDVVTIKSNVRMNGVFLNEGEQIGIIDPTSGAEQLDQVEDERQFDTSEIEQKVTAPDSNRKILEEIKELRPGTSRALRSISQRF